MPDPATRFIGLATRSLEGDAKEIAATELAARLAHAGADDGAVEEAAARLEKGRVTSGSRRMWVFGFAVVGLAVILAVLMPRHWREARLLEPVHRQGVDGEYLARVLTTIGGGADVDLGNSYFDARTGGIETKVIRDPAGIERIERSTGFLRLLFHFLGGASDLPPDFEEWQDLDPGNALWLLYAADRTATGGASLAADGKVVVRDEARFESALQLFHRAAACDHVRFYGAKDRELRMSIFAHDGSLKSAHMRTALLDAGGHSNQFYLLSLWGAVLAKAERCEREKDGEELRMIMEDLRKVLILIYSNPESFVGGTHARDLESWQALAAVCRRMGLASETDRLSRLVKILSGVVNRAISFDGGDVELQSGALGKMRSDIYQAYTSEDAFTPGRLAEYAVADRFTALAGVLAAFLVAAGGLIEILRRGSHSRRLAGGLMPLFRATDRAWLIGLGLVLPAVWWFGITWYSPLGCRDIGLTFFEIKGFPMMQPWLSQGLGGLVLAFVLLVQTARWRLGKRGAFLSLRPERMWIGWTMAVLAALFIPAQGIVRYLSADQDKFLLYGSAAGGIALLWLLWQAAMGLFAARENALGGQVLLRLLMPGVIVLALLLLGAMPLLRKSERKWVAEMDRFSTVSLGLPSGASRGTDFDEIRKELLEALE